MRSVGVDQTEILNSHKDALKGCGSHQGHTLVELVLVFIIIGIVAALTIPRFASKDAFEERGFFEP